MDVLSKFRLDDRVAIVTGGGRGIGRAIAVHFAYQGAQVVVTALHQNTIEETAKEVRAVGRKCLPFVADSTKSEDVTRVAKTTIEEFGRIDILVNNVGLANPLTPLTRLSDEQWDWFIRVNLTSAFLFSKVVGRIMVAQRRGNIINISTAASTRAVPGLAPYAAAKAGMNNLTKGLSVELAGYKVRVNAIIPGAIETELGSALRGSAEERVERAGIPLGRIGRPEDIALAAVYLASDASDWVTGTFIEVIGGPMTRKGDTEMFTSKFPEL
jgi:NAD(P)-dependent dehydrogenase (short-subunit alcohol dehydrogenase family)